MKETITIRCSCGGTWEEPAADIWSRAIDSFNSSGHETHAVPEDLREQVAARLQDLEEGER